MLHDNGLLLVRTTESGYSRNAGGGGSGWGGGDVGVGAGEGDADARDGVGDIRPGGDAAASRAAIGVALVGEAKRGVALEAMGGTFLLLREAVVADVARSPRSRRMSFKGIGGGRTLKSESGSVVRLISNSKTTGSGVGICTRVGLVEPSADKAATASICANNVAAQLSVLLNNPIPHIRRNSPAPRSIGLTRGKLNRAAANGQRESVE